jgi:hypothetical protein
MFLVETNHNRKESKHNYQVLESGLVDVKTFFSIDHLATVVGLQLSACGFTTISVTEIPDDAFATMWLNVVNCHGFSKHPRFDTNNTDVLSRSNEPRFIHVALLE